MNLHRVSTRQTEAAEEVVAEGEVDPAPEDVVPEVEVLEARGLEAVVEAEEEEERKEEENLPTRTEMMKVVKIFKTESNTERDQKEEMTGHSEDEEAEEEEDTLMLHTDFVLSTADQNIRMGRQVSVQISRRCQFWDEGNL